jgi:hypothetical protein
MIKIKASSGIGKGCHLTRATSDGLRAASAKKLKNKKTPA